MDYSIYMDFFTLHAAVSTAPSYYQRTFQTQYVVREQLTALRFGCLHSSQVALQTRKNKTKKKEKEKTKQSENVVQRCFQTLKGYLREETPRMSCHIFRHLLQGRLFESGRRCTGAFGDARVSSRSDLSPRCSLPSDAVKGIVGEREGEREGGSPPTPNPVTEAAKRCHVMSGASVC